MSAEQRLRAAQALWNEAEARSEQIQAVGAIAKQFKFRPKTVAVTSAPRGTVSESGTLRQGARVYLPGERRRRGLVLPMLFSSLTTTPKFCPWP